MVIRGSGEDGQLGLGDNEEKEWVSVIKALENEQVRSVVAGSRNSLAICRDGKVSLFIFYFFFSDFLIDFICDTISLLWRGGDLLCCALLTCNVLVPPKLCLCK